MLNKDCVKGNFTSNSFSALSEVLSKSADRAPRYTNIEMTNILKKYTESGRPLVIYGAGNYGQKIADILRINYEIPVNFIVDKNERLLGTVRSGLVILLPEALMFSDAVVVIAVERYFIDDKTKAEIDRHLQRMGVIDIIPANLIVNGTSLGSYYYPGVRNNESALCFYRKNEERLIKSCSIMADEESYEAIIETVRARCEQDIYRLPYREDAHYFAEEVYSFRDDDVVLDCGSYNAEMVFHLMRYCCGYKQIFCFEADPSYHEQCVRVVRNLPPEMRHKVSIINKAVSSTSGTLSFLSQEGRSGRLYSGGNIEVEAVTLDDEVMQYHPTFIKMDIEGAELDALRGAEKLIDAHRPILIICIYHKWEDLFEIPLWIYERWPDYTFYVRKYGPTIWELILFAVPKSRTLKQSDSAER